MLQAYWNRQIRSHKLAALEKERVDMEAAYILASKYALTFGGNPRTYGVNAMIEQRIRDQLSTAYETVC
jgi:hypothetical protein